MEIVLKQVNELGRELDLIAKTKNEGGKKRVSRAEAAVPALVNANPMTAKIIARNVEIDADREGESEGSATTNEYDARASLVFGMC